MLVIGHRGAPAVAPENTIPSFEAAIAAGADAVEFDVRLTADGALVCMHDDDVARTTGARGFVSEMTLEQVRALVVGSEGPGPASRVPVLAEVLEVVGGRVGLVVELKATWDARGYQPAVPVARAALPALGAIPNLIVSSFDAAAVELVRSEAPGIATALSVLRGFPIDAAIQAAAAAGHREIHPAEETVDEAVVARARAASLRVCCWTVNDAARARALRAAGADGVFTDDPAAIRAALRDDPR